MNLWKEPVNRIVSSPERAVPNLLGELRLLLRGAGVIPKELWMRIPQKSGSDDLRLFDVTQVLRAAGP